MAIRNTSVLKRNKKYGMVLTYYMKRFAFVNAKLYFTVIGVAYFFVANGFVKLAIYQLIQYTSKLWAASIKVYTIARYPKTCVRNIFMQFLMP